MTNFSRCILGVGVALLAGSSTLQAQDYKVIVNSANSTTDLPADVTAKLFLKQNPAVAKDIEDKIRSANGLDFSMSGEDREAVLDD